MPTEERDLPTPDDFLKGLWRENPVFVQILGMCPVLAVTNSALNGLTMGLATLFVLVLSNALRPAVHGLAKSLSRSAGAVITVNCVCPGFTDTERLRDLAAAAARRRGVAPEEVFTGWRSHIPRGELGRPGEIAAAVAFLCSEPASFINGVSLAVDGGESRPLL